MLNEENNFNPNNEDNNQLNNNGDKKNKRAVLLAIIIPIVVFVVACVITVVAILGKGSGQSAIDDFLNDDGNKSASTENQIGSTDTIDDNEQSSSGVMVTDVSGVVENAMPSIVAITSSSIVQSSESYYDDFFREYFGEEYGSSKSQEQISAGSGIIVDQTDTEVLIVTNNHVVEKSDSLSIQFNGDDENGVTGYLKGTDSNADIAIVAVKIKDIPAEILKNIKKATLGNSSNVKVGEGVIAIGNALGYGQSVTTGVISAKDREVNIENKKMTLLQTDAAINGGNSGGALINAKGEVIGINVAKYSSSGYDSSASIEGMGFAIPISSVEKLISQLENQKTKDEKYTEEEQGYLGIVGYTVGDQDSAKYSIPKGVFIFSVNDNGPAEKAGITAKSVITKIEGQSITDMEELQSHLTYYKKGEKVKITVQYPSENGYKEKTVTVTLGGKDILDNATIPN